MFARRAPQPRLKGPCQPRPEQDAVPRFATQAFFVVGSNSPAIMCPEARFPSIGSGHELRGEAVRAANYHRPYDLSDQMRDRKPDPVSSGRNEESVLTRDGSDKGL